MDFVDLCKRKLGDGLKCIIFYGSRARGTSKAGSDWDFFVVAEDLTTRRIDRYAFFREIENMIYEKYCKTIQIESYSPNEAQVLPPSPLIYGILTGYEVLYGRDYWNKLLKKLTPVIKKRKPLLYQEGQEWKIAQMV